MNDDISAALRRFAADQAHVAGASAPDAAVEAGALARRVSHRRAVRTGSAMLSATAVVGAVAVGVLLSGSRTPAPPAILEPTPTSAPSPSTPTPTVTPTATPTASAPTALRDASPMAPGMLEAAGDGWRVLRYETWDEQENVLLPATVYLVDPDGRPFTVPTATDPADWYLLDWLPGSALVVAQSSTDGATRVLDLLTGESGPTLGSDYGTRFARDGSGDVLLTGARSHPGVFRVAADGTVRAAAEPFGSHYGSASWVENPAGTRIVLNDAAGPRVVTADDFSPVAFSEPYPDRPDACRVWMWVDDSSVLMECAQGGDAAFAVGSPSEFWLAPTDAATARQLVGLPDATRLGGVWRVGDRLVAGTFGPTEAEVGWWEVTGDGVVPLSQGGVPQLSVGDLQGSELVGLRRPYASPGVPTTASLVAIDPVSGSTRVLVEGEPAWFASLSFAPNRYVGAPQTDIGD